jgi:hypothetical protein
MEIMAIHSWKSQKISVYMVFGYDPLCDLLEILNFNKYIGVLLQLAET